MKWDTSSDACSLNRHTTDISEETHLYSWQWKDDLLIIWFHSCFLQLDTRDRTVGLQVLALDGEVELGTPVLLLF
jgi:hypothetical protein